MQPPYKEKKVDYFIELKDGQTIHILSQIERLKGMQWRHVFIQGGGVKYQHGEHWRISPENEIKIQGYEPLESFPLTYLIPKKDVTDLSIVIANDAGDIRQFIHSIL